jgi:hypothetical protein
MKLKPNISCKYVGLLIIYLIVSSCEDGYLYQKIKIDSKNRKIEILSEEYVFDSIVIENNDKTFYKAYLLDKKYGCNVLYLNKFSEKNYLVNNENFDEMCYEKYDNGMKSFNIFIRNKKYYGTNKFQDRENIQKFNIGYFPCDNQIIVLEAIGRH